MSGGGGGVIIRGHARAALSDPVVHGQLPTGMQAAVDTVLAKDDGDWNTVDCLVIAAAHSWALCHCS